MKYGIDGNQTYAIDCDFIDLQVSHAGFGDTKKEAFLDYHRTLKSKSIDWSELEEFEIEWLPEI